MLQNKCETILIGVNQSKTTGKVCLYLKLKTLESNLSDKDFFDGEIIKQSKSVLKFEEISKFKETFFS